MAKAAVKTKEDVTNFSEVLELAQKEKKSPFAYIANMAETVSKKFKIAQFLKYSKEDIEVQINKAERDLTDQDEQLLELGFEVEKYANTEHDRLRLFTKMINIERNKRKLNEDIEDWKAILEYFETPKKA